jgi:colicin import membrane protein
VRCAPDGSIISSKLLEKSGIPAWDEAVQRAVDRTEVLPRNEECKVPSVIQLYFKPKDF